MIESVVQYSKIFLFAAVIPVTVFVLILFSTLAEY